MKKFKDLWEIILGQGLYSVPSFPKLLKIGFKRLIVFLCPYIKYKQDQKKNTKDNYCYYNFWNNIHKESFWLQRFIDINNLNKDNKNIDFYSVFGPKRCLKFSKNIKIFYTGEYIGKDRFPSYDDYCLGKVDFSVGFREYNRKDYCRLPLRLTTLIEPKETSLEQIKKKIEKLELEKIKFKKNKFACLIASHNDKNGVRTDTYNVLSSIGKIDCPGLLLHNIDIKIPKYEDKINFMKDYKFNICPENKYYKGYVTEKFIDAIKSGCIPIYHGCFNEFDEKIFNESRILFCDDKDLKDKVEELNSNKEKYLDFIKQPIFKDNVVNILFDYIEEFDSLFRKIFN